MPGGSGPRKSLQELTQRELVTEPLGFTALSLILAAVFVWGDFVDGSDENFRRWLAAVIVGVVGLQWVRVIRELARRRRAKPF